MDDLTLPGAPAPGERRAVRCRGRGCNRPLYDAESRALQLGPECRSQEFAPRSHDVEQDALPGL